MNKIKSLIRLPLLLTLSATATANSDHQWVGQVNGVANYNDAAATWLDGGLGRFGVDSDDGDSVGLLGEVQLGYNYRLNDQFSIRTHLQVQETTEDSSARSVGVVELKARYVIAPEWDQKFTFTAGQFFLPISLENTNRFWESPYTINFSSLNSWIGEEFRPIGVDASYKKTFESGNQWSLATTIFGGNDSMGAILAWRGWSHGRHRSVFGDTLSLPELDSLNTGGPFEDQRDDGSKPFGRDLDDRPGYAIRTAWQTEDYLFNLSWVDNLGDTELHHGEYAWRTKFAILGASWFVTDEFELLAEGTSGSTTMGAGPGVDVNFYSAYIMASYLVNELRYSARLEKFAAHDKDAVDDENNDSGRSYTLAIMWEPEESNVSGGAELLYVDSKRIRMTSNGTFEDQESISISLLAKYAF
ncbi:hypothetical protein [Litoribacillus peritrichatus]|uniref:Porin n=1 Tax=Litoribacillus peritrichatus TaxID=718191 RepID=A0ABP7ME74_9GAMM